MTRFERDELYRKALQNRRSKPSEAVDSGGTEDDARTEDEEKE